MFWRLKMWLFVRAIKSIERIDHYIVEGQTNYHHKDFTVEIVGSEYHIHKSPTNAPPVEEGAKKLQTTKKEKISRNEVEGTKGGVGGQQSEG